jgi:hypothetical protein
MASFVPYHDNDGAPAATVLDDDYQKIEVIKKHDKHATKSPLRKSFPFTPPVFHSACLSLRLSFTLSTPSPTTY